ncbi:MAG TPA: N-acetylmuramic acid 6-phosphate etherase [Selenomonadales bacterium]|nr:N-acetylmuramic acid 6-phosphate etherase [Selenomonadales bacterium]
MQGYNPATSNIDEVSTLEMIQMFNQEDQKVALAVAECKTAIAAAVDAAVQVLKAGGRMVYIGSGTAGKIGVMDASECPPTFGVDDNTVVGVISGGFEGVVGWREDTEDDERLAARDLEAYAFSGRDVLVCISASGSTPYVLAAAHHARRLGAQTVGLSCSPGSKLEQAVDIAISVDVGPEAIMGSTRLKAGTAQKMVLNMLSSCAMIRMGKTYGNLMVGVRPLNEKLRRRVVDVVRLASGCDEAASRRALEAAGFSAKVAIVMLRAGLEAAQAEERLARYGGYVKKAVRG